MLRRLKNWIQGSRRKPGERWEADRGHLSEQEKHVVDVHEGAGNLGGFGVEDAIHGPKGFDETRRGR
jgi:hypothetical protein